MGILSITTDTAGQINVNPRRVKIITTDNLATITTAGYLNRIALQGYTILPTDFLDIDYSFNAATNSGTLETFVASFSNGVITLSQWNNPGDILLPVVSGNLAVFNGTAGQLKDSGIAAANTMPSIIASPDPASDLILIDITLTTIILASAQKAVIQLGSGSKQYTVRDIKVNTSTGFSGGGGNRLLALTDGTNAFNASGITAALLGTPVNTVWGGTGNPLPSISFLTPSVAGQNIYFQYAGGTTDYTAGEVDVSVLLMRIV